MDIITVDFETYYDKKFSLSKLTTEQYIRRPDFEVIGLGVKLNNEETVWLSGEHHDIRQYLHENYDWENSALLAHNTMFDGAILSWIFDIHPKLLLDTLCMARGLHGVEVGGSLKHLSDMYEVGEKGDEVTNALGIRRKDFTEEALSKYGDYCIQDVELTYKLFGILMKVFPKKELKVIDMTLRMFVEPKLTLDVAKLEDHLDSLQEQKEKLLEECGIGKAELMSNPKFALALEELGVKPPKKTSLRTGEKTFAFAKNDEAFKALQEHDDPRVQALVAARIGLKSTLEETRTERFIDIGLGGTLPVPIRYYAAHTGRWGGLDKVNLQNLPSRGPNAKVLKSCICAPSGHTLIEADSAQIEARVLAWLAEQKNLVRAFEKGEDVYKKMAASIYNKKVEDVDAAERFIGKTTILGAGYGMGAVRFREQLLGMGVEVEAKECKRIIDVYRNTNSKITELWDNAQAMVSALTRGEKMLLGRKGVLSTLPEVKGLKLPSKLIMRYEDLKVDKPKGKEKSEDEERPSYSYKTRRGRVNIYGGKVIENVCQAIARCVMSDQMLLISKRYPILLTVHDSVICCVPDDEVDEAAAYVDSCMRYTPDWAKGLPVRGDVDVGKNYGECEAWVNPHGPLAA